MTSPNSVYEQTQVLISTTICRIELKKSNKDVENWTATSTTTQVSRITTEVAHALSGTYRVLTQILWKHN